MHSKANQPLREHVERGIYKRRTGDGEIRYEVAFLDSDRRQRWRTVATLKEARDLRAELVTRVNRGERVAPTNVTFGDYAASWLATQTRLRPTTHRLYATYLRIHLTPRLGRWYPLASPRPAGIRERPSAQDVARGRPIAPLAWPRGLPHFR